MCVLENKNLVFCQDCVLKDYGSTCRVIKKIVTPERILDLNSDCRILNKENNCKYFKKFTHWWENFSREKKFLEDKIEDKEKSYYKKEGW